MINILFGALALGILILLFVAWASYSAIKELGRIESFPRLPDEEREQDSDQWASKNGFLFSGNFYMKISGVETYISSWIHQIEPTYFCDYLCRGFEGKGQNQKILLTKRTFDLVTFFKSGGALTTSSTKDGQSQPPKPGCYMQSFSTTDLDEFLGLHNQAVQYLLAVGGEHSGTLIGSPDKAMIRFIHETVDYIRSLPFWPIRSVYWYFVRCPLMHSLTIQEQHQKGKIKLPNELKQI